MRRARDSLSPLDGRYAGHLGAMRAIFSERALVRNRVRVEVAYLFGVAERLGITARAAPDEVAEVRQTLELCGQGIDVEIIDLAFRLEEETRHDVKAVELAIRARLTALAGNAFAAALVPLVHFGLTSQDVTGCAVWLQLLAGRRQIANLVARIGAHLYRVGYVPHRRRALLAMTHGQPATPTTFGKEMMVFVERLGRARASLMDVPPTTKFGGATGGLNAHALAYPEVDWNAFADRFVRTEFGLERQQFTTQIEHYDNVAALLDALRRVNTVLIDLCQDVWLYVSRGILVQARGEDSEVGSSTMPHKINPIQFENAEGNLGMANAVLGFIAQKLPVSRMQRDLTDSTVLRNLGVAFGHSALAMENVLAGLSRIAVDEDAVQDELDSEPAVLTEALQVLLRREGRADAYECVKRASRGMPLDWDGVQALSEAELGDLDLRVRMGVLTPDTYAPTLPSPGKVREIMDLFAQ